MSDLVSNILDRLLELPSALRKAELQKACEQHPELAARLMARWRALDQLGLLADEPQGDTTPERLGEFRLSAMLGGGGMGVVYRAYQDGLGREVALKLIRPELMFFENSKARFRREVEAVARLNHPGIVPIYTYGDSQGIAYYAMEYVAGRTLADVLLKLSGTTPTNLSGSQLHVGASGSWIEACVRLIIRIGEALAHAHERGVVHRDVKPSNVMLADDGRVLLIDFGLAAASGSGAITQSGARLGSLPYSSPEQVSGDLAAVDPRTDVFALGVMLYELLALQLPFGGIGQQVVQAILTKDPPDLQRCNPHVHADLVAIVGKALEKPRPRRYASMRELVSDLQAFLEHRPVVARRPTWNQRVSKWARREPLKAAGVALLLVAIPTMAALAGYLWKSEQERARGRAAALAERVEHDLAEGFLALAERSQVGRERAAERFRQALALSPESIEAKAGLHAAMQSSGPPDSRPSSSGMSAADLFVAAVPEIESGARGDRQPAIRAVHRLEAAVQRCPHARPVYYYQWARAAGIAMVRESAEQASQALVLQWPDRSLAHFWAGFAMMEIDPQIARDHFQRALQLDPNAAAAHANLAIVLGKLGHTEEAVRIQRQALAASPHMVQARINLAQYLLALGQAEPALAEAERCAAEAPSLPGAHYALGLVRQHRGEIELAIAAYTKVVELEPRYREALLNLGALAMLARDYGRAAQWFSRAVEVAPEWADAQVNLAGALLGLRDAEAAAQAFARAVVLAPTDRDAHEQYCELLQSMGKHDAVQAERARFAAVLPAK